MSEIDRLNNDCLHYIFSWLSFEERLEIMTTCKRWYRLIEQCWHSIDTLTLRFEDHVREIRRHLDPVRFLDQSLARVGSYVRRLSLQYLQLNPEQAKTIADGCHRLNSLSLHFVDMSAECLLEFGSLHQLQTLQLTFCISTYAQESMLALLFSRLRSLKTLNLSHNILTGSCLTQLPSTISRISLPFLADTNFTGACLYAFLAASPELLALRLPRLHVNLLPVLARCCPRLEHLEFRQFQIGANGKPSFSGLTSLRWLVASGAVGFTSEPLISASLNCPQLSVLDLRRTGVDAAGLYAIARFRRLRVLNLGRLPVTDSMLGVILGSCGSGLRLLNLGSCKVLTSRSLAVIRNQCPEIQVLDLSGCHGIGPIKREHVIEEWNRKCPITARQLVLRQRSSCK